MTTVVAADGASRRAENAARARTLVALAFCMGVAGAAGVAVGASGGGARPAHAQQRPQATAQAAGAGYRAGRYALVVTPAVASGNGGIVRDESLHLLDTQTGQVWESYKREGGGTGWNNLGSPLKPVKPRR